MERSRHSRASWPSVGAVILGGAAALGLGCQSILGIHDVMLEGNGGGAATSSSNSTSSSGSQTPDFTFAITDPSLNVPYGGLNYVNVLVTPSGGFDGMITIGPQGAPTGFTSMPLTLPAGSTTGRLQVGAMGALSLGTMFNLTLSATSGAITKTASVPAVVTGKPGDFDQSFGGGIILGPTFSAWSGFTAIHHLPTGKILASGLQFGKLGGGGGFVSRYLSDGTLDMSFGMMGNQGLSFCGCSAPPESLVSAAREVNGLMLFVGSGVPAAGMNDEVYLFRLRDNGALDSIQGDTGVDMFGLGKVVIARAAELVPNSTNTVVAGETDGALFVARLPDRYGGFDMTFAPPSGVLLPMLGGTKSSAGALAIDPMGRVLVAGWITTAMNGDDMVLLRLSSDGALDSSFGKGGVVNVTRPGDQHGWALLAEADGSVVMAGDTSEGNAPQHLVMRFTSAGAPDATFGSAGEVLLPLGNNPNSVPWLGAAWLAQMIDGRIIVGGNGKIGSTVGPVFTRLLPDGSLDPTFGAGGQIALYVGDYGILGAMALDNTGKLLIGGSNSPNPPGASYIARLWN